MGDSLENDVAGAPARPGIRAVLVARDGRPPAGVEAIARFGELPSLV